MKKRLENQSEFHNQIIMQMDIRCIKSGAIDLFD